MSERPWIIPVVAAVILLSVIVLVRQGVQPPPLDDTERAAPVRTPARNQRARLAERARVRGDADFDASRDAIPAAQGNQHDAVKPVQPEKALTPRAGSPVLPAETPEGTPGNGAMVVKPRLSVSFDGSTDGADGTAPLKAEGIESDESLGATRFSAMAEVMYPDSGGIDTSAGTLAFWVHMEWDPTQPDRRSKTLAELRAGGWNNRIECNLGPPLIGCLFTNSDGVEQSVAAHIAWQLGDWHHVGVTWGDSVASFYVDGALQSARELIGTIEIPPGTPLYVGSTYNGPLRPNQGPVSLRGWVVFQESLLPEDIAALMVQTAPPAS